MPHNFLRLATALLSYTYMGSPTFIIIDYMRGILQGDLLSLTLFVLSVNPLSYLLSKEKGYTLNVTKRGISHLSFVDDLKLYASI